MTWKKMSLLLLFALIGQSVTQDISSFVISVTTGWQFDCVNTTCIPFVTITASSIRACQISCLRQPQCQAASFDRSTSSCKLFTNIPDPNSNLLIDAETVTMIVKSGTRMPPG